MLERSKKDFATQYEEVVAKFPVSEMVPIPVRIPAVEEMRLPPFARHWRYVMSPNNFWESYVDEYGRAIKRLLERIALTEHPTADVDSLSLGELWRGVQARARRGWFSLAREHHLYLQFMRHFDLVSRSYDLDYYHGIDVLIIYHGEPFGIRAYTKTWRGLEYSGARRGKFSKATDHINMIDMPMSLDGPNSVTINGVRFYAAPIVEQVAKYIMLDARGLPFEKEWEPENTTIDEVDVVI